MGFKFYPARSAGSSVTPVPMFSCARFHARKHITPPPELTNARSDKQRQRGVTADPAPAARDKLKTNA
jgi:hypothetical protein